MIQNNIKFLRDKITFDEDGLMYTIMVLQRGKDGQPNRCLKIYHIFNLADYDKITNLVPSYCEEHNARAYISICPKKIEEVGMDMIINAAVFIKTKQYKCLLDLFNSTFGSTKVYGKNKWIVDIDTDDANVHDKVIEFTKEHTNIFYLNKTKSGLHIVTEGFNPNLYMNKLKDIYPEVVEFVEIKKNNANTLLYV